MEMQPVTQAARGVQGGHSGGAVMRHLGTQSTGGGGLMTCVCPSPASLSARGEMSTPMYRGQQHTRTNACTYIHIHTHTHTHAQAHTYPPHPPTHTQDNLQVTLLLLQHGCTRVTGLQCLGELTMPGCWMPFITLHMVSRRQLPPYLSRQHHGIPALLLQPSADVLVCSALGGCRRWDGVHLSCGTRGRGGRRGGGGEGYSYEGGSQKGRGNTSYTL